MAAFREKHPDRFINVGVAEQSMIGICAGLALRGMRPFAYTIATFALYRPFEFIRNDLAYQRLPVTVVGIGGGVVYSTLGATHYAQEDIAVACAIPNMDVLAPSDPLEVDVIVRHLAASDRENPTYLRLGKTGEPIITKNSVEAFAFGKLRKVREGVDRVAVLSYGISMSLAHDRVVKMQREGVNASLWACPTLKPLDLSGISGLLAENDRIIIIEEHVPQGGLSAHVKQIAWEIDADCDLQIQTLKDEFVHCYGNHDDLRAKHGCPARL
jgi:transketolase